MKKRTLKIKRARLRSRSLIAAERTGQELGSTGSFLVIDEEGLGQERAGVGAGILRDRWAGVTTSADLENGLKLGAVGMRMASSKHLNDETAEGPNVGLAGISGLTNNFRSHPKDGTLE